MFEPEVWESLKGLGCWNCKYERPIIKLHRYALCFTCLCGWFPGRSDQDVADWLIRQREAGMRPRRRASQGRQLALAI